LKFIKIKAAIVGLIIALALVGCSTAPGLGGGGEWAASGGVARTGSTAEAGASTEAGALAKAGPTVIIYVIKRSWHTDIGFNAADLHAPLASLRPALPEARYLLFGFGDKHYLMNHGDSIGGLVGAVWPGEGLVLMTGLEATPEEAFGAAGAIRLKLSATQARKLEGFVWNTLATPNGVASVLAPGPYSGSLYYESATRYSGLHTCNTWTAEGLRTAGLPVRSFGVEFSGQVWRQVRRVKRQQEAPNGGAAPQTRAAPP
jgi:Protein of unknown function (DUF2459)